MRRKTGTGRRRRKVLGSRARETAIYRWSRSEDNAIAMKKIFIYILLALFSITVMEIAPARDLIVYAQKGKKEKKDPPGPPVVREKERPKGGDKKGEPKRGKKQDDF